MKKKLTLTALYILMLITLSATGVYANYQSVGRGNSSSQYAKDWIMEVRKMESTGQVMGLTETIDTTTGIATTSNNIDVHMMKNTEYGAIVILGASEYGKKGTGTTRYMNTGTTTTSGIDVKATTTGNVYGLYEIGYSDMNVSRTGPEWVAGGTDTFLADSFPNLAKRYINRYKTSATSAIVGDATEETKQWHNSVYATWINGNGNRTYPWL